MRGPEQEDVVRATELVVMAALVASGASAQEAAGPGISRDLAQARSRDLSNVTYDLSFRIPAKPDELIHGRVAIGFDWAGAGPLVLDFDAPQDHVLAVSVGGDPAGFALVAGHIVIPANLLKRGHQEVEVAFVAGDGPLNRNDDFMYTLFVPDRAHEAFPCFDQPDLKARFTLTLDLPTAWKAVSNGAQEDSTVSGDRTVRRFARTRPLPTYLFAFAAGDFKVETATRHGRVMHMYHRENDSAKVARNAEAIFDLHDRALRWLEDYTGIPYPFGKFDFVLIPSFQYGGMEHPGAIYYRANSLMLDASATLNQELGRASVISHETSHMWFGDLVTMRWFNDVWMKEVFANFMAAKIVNPSFPEIDHELRFLLAYYPSAYEVDRTAGANPIRQQLDNLDDAGSLYGAIIYQKAPIVMRQLEALVGADTFRDGLREYLKAHEYGNATWPDLIRVLDKRTDEDLAAWSHAWVEQPGRPTIDDIAHVGRPDRRPGADPDGPLAEPPPRLEPAAHRGNGLRRLRVHDPGPPGDAPSRRVAGPGPACASLGAGQRRDVGVWPVRARLGHHGLPVNLGRAPAGCPPAGRGLADRLGRHAGTPRISGHRDVAGPGNVVRRAERAERAASAVRPVGRVLALRRPAGSTPPGATPGGVPVAAHAEDGAAAHEGGVLQRVAQHSADGRGRGAPATHLVAAGLHPGAAPVGGRLHRPGFRAGDPWRAG
ncbi:MAG: M1 family aminopeptidase [Gemmatimonadota bacterium]